MNATSTERNIPWFNPREMDDRTVTALATGRDELLRDFIAAIRQRLESPVPTTAGAHWLVTGTRGAGKSFFLRYAQIGVPKAFPEGSVRFVLLPEELRNVRAPHDVLDEIRRMLDVAQGNRGRPAMWRTENSEKAWKDSLAKLLAAFKEPLLIVGVENFGQLLGKAFADDVSASLLRKLMEHEERILFLATAVDGSEGNFDDNYGNRLYRQFEKRLLPSWDGKAHRLYLQERARLSKRKPTLQQLARIDAYSRYTGGNPRIAAILAAAILDEQDIVDASADLNDTVDKMSDYYRALLDALPENSETLFDALVRGGEPCSQTQLAERVGARQNDISRAFAKLLEAGYLYAYRPKGQKETRYQVADRLFVQWYRMRYIDPGQRGRLAVLADLLADTIAYNDKWRYAERFVDQGEDDDALLMAGLAYRERGIDIEPLRAEGIALATLLEWGRRMPSDHEDLLHLMEMFPTDAAMREAKEVALTLARNCTRFDGAYSGVSLADLTLGSLSLSPVEKLRILRAISRISQFQWDELVKVLNNETAEFSKLVSSEGAAIRTLQDKHDREWRHPWLNSWEEIRRKPLDNAEEVAEVEILRTAAFAVEWLYRLREKDDVAPELWAGLAGSINKAEVQGWWGELLQICERALNALPATSDCALARARLLAAQAEVHSHYEQQLQSAQQALALLGDQAVSSESDNVRLTALERQGWALGALDRWPEALASHRAALVLAKGMSWHIGQAARYLWHVEGLESAWKWIAARDLGKEALAYCIGQLGDGVCDVQRREGATRAYAAGRELLTDLLRQSGRFGAVPLPLETAVRYIFISMLDTGLDLQVLQDLAQDLPSFAPPTDEQLAASLSLLAGTLHRWFGELRNPAAMDKNAPPLDPDWATSVAALNGELSFSARVRLGLTELPRPSKEAASVFARILAFIK